MLLATTAAGLAVVLLVVVLASAASSAAGLALALLMLLVLLGAALARPGALLLRRQLGDPGVSGEVDAPPVRDHRVVLALVDLVEDLAVRDREPGRRLVVGVGGVDDVVDHACRAADEPPDVDTPDRVPAGGVERVEVVVGRSDVDRGRRARRVGDGGGRVDRAPGRVRPGDVAARCLEAV